MKKRYQVFISSTFADLKDERNMVMQAVLERKCFPAGMELFPAIDKEQFEYIKKVIDDSDYYLLIIGARYGSMDDNGVSFTEKEYDYAVKKGIPVIAFLHSDISSIPLGKTDGDKKLLKKLEAFRSKVQTGRLVNYWKNAHDLKAKVISSLVDVFEEEPKIGWVRADTVSAASKAMLDKQEKEIAWYQENLAKLKEDIKAKEMDCHSLEQSNLDARRQLKSIQKMIKQLQNECVNFIALKDNCKVEGPSVEKSYQEELNDVATELEKILEKFNSNLTTMKIKPKVERITIELAGVSFNMVCVEGGTFLMGANEGDEYADSDEKPAHQVTLSDYYIGETQVTQALWQAVMGNNPSHFKGHLSLPVEQVSWHDCREFIMKLNQLTGKSFRLPTEAEWEFAARGANKSKGYKYSGSDYCSSVAWYDANSGRITHAVAQKGANELGLYDMSGNVYEWCQDFFGPYSSDEQIAPQGPSLGSYRVVRGGSWAFAAEGCRIPYRIGFAQTYASSFLGLRLAL